jgi:hypothetical protein
VIIPQEVTCADKTYTVTEIGAQAFNFCRTISSVALPQTITQIGSGAFRNCTALSGIDLPSSVEEIGAQAFYGCTSLSSIVLPKAVTEIKIGTFSGCTSLLNIELPEALTTIGNGAFTRCKSLSALQLPGTVTTIENQAFYACTQLSSFNLPSLVATMGTGCFANCLSLQTITVDSDNQNFQAQDGILFNKGLTTLYCYPAGKEGSQYTIPNSVTEVIESAFEGNTYLNNIEIQSLVATIASRCFCECSNLKAITVNSDNQHFQAQDGVLFNKELTTLYCYPMGKEGNQYTVPNSVTEIGEYAFYDVTLNGIELPNTVTRIGDYAFYHDSYLSDINLPSTLSQIGGMAFYNCQSLRDIEFPESLTSIGYDAFYYCMRLHRLEFPSGLTSIGSSAFYGCDSITEVVSHAIVPMTTTSTATFSNSTYTNATLYVPDESVEAYSVAKYAWYKFQNIKPLSEYAADVSGNDGTGETEEPSGSDVTNIQGAEAAAPTFSLQGHTLYLSGAATVIRTDGTLVYVGNGPVALTPGCYFIRVAGETRKVMIP